MSEAPLCVSLDGGLIRSDLLSEGIVRLLRDDVRNCFVIPLWRLRGTAALNAGVERTVEWDETLLPDNPELLAWLREQRNAGRRLVLCAPCGAPLAARVAARYELFDEVVTYGPGDSAGRGLNECLEARFGAGHFELVDEAQAQQSFPGPPVSIRTWLRAFRVPEGLAVRPMVQLEPGPWVGLIVLDRKPSSIIAEALLTAATDPQVAQSLADLEATSSR